MTYISATILFTALLSTSALPADPLIADGAEVEKIAGGFVWAEGPAWTPDGFLYFTDNRVNRVYRWSRESGSETFLLNANGANGLFASLGENILCCFGSGKTIGAIDSRGIVTVIADAVDGEPLNSPNDLWIDAKGGIYFTDPFWGREKGRDRVCYLTPDRKSVITLITDMVKPNGIHGSLDGSTLYVTDWNEKVTYAYPINGDGTAGDRSLFAPEGDDGLTIDEHGNVYLTGERLAVYSPDGEFIEAIPVPETSANVCFGGPGYRTLFITARTSVYAVSMNVRGMHHE